MERKELKKLIYSSYKDYKSTFGKEPTSCLVKVRYEGSSEPCNELQTIVIDNGHVNPNDFQGEVLYVTTSYKNLYHCIGFLSIEYNGFEVVDFISFN